MVVWRLILITFVWILYVESCSQPENYNPPTFEEDLYRASLVIYGKDIEHVVYSKTQWENYTDSIFHVYCILKNNIGIALSENITIKQIDPSKNPCIDYDLKVGEEAIMLVRSLGNDTVEWDPKASSQVFKTKGKDYLSRAMKVCGFQNLTSPMMARSGNRCPSLIKASSECITPSSSQRTSGIQLTLLTLLVLAAEMFFV